MQALPRGSRRFSGPGRRSSSGGIARSGSLDSAAKPKQQTHLELELVAIGVGLQFVELEEGRKVLLLSAGCAVRTDSVLAIFTLTLQDYWHNRSAPSELRSSLQLCFTDSRVDPMLNSFNCEQMLILARCMQDKQVMQTKRSAADLSAIGAHGGRSRSVCMLVANIPHETLSHSILLHAGEGGHADQEERCRPVGHWRG